MKLALVLALVGASFAAEVSIAEETGHDGNLAADILRQNTQNSIARVHAKFSTINGNLTILPENYTHPVNATVGLYPVNHTFGFQHPHNLTFFPMNGTRLPTIASMTYHIVENATDNSTEITIGANGTHVLVWFNHSHSAVAPFNGTAVEWHRRHGRHHAGPGGRGGHGGHGGHGNWTHHKGPHGNWTHGGDHGNWTHHKGPHGNWTHGGDHGNWTHGGDHGNWTHHKGPHGNWTHGGDHGNWTHHKGPHGNWTRHGGNGNWTHHKGPHGNWTHHKGPHGGKGNWSHGGHHGNWPHNVTGNWTFPNATHGNWTHRAVNNVAVINNQNVAAHELQSKIEGLKAKASQLANNVAVINNQNVGAKGVQAKLEELKAKTSKVANNVAVVNNKTGDEAQAKIADLMQNWKGKSANATKDAVMAAKPANGTVDTAAVSSALDSVKAAVSNAVRKVAQAVTTVASAVKSWLGGWFGKK